MSHPHEHEDRELVSEMERALAAAVAAGASLTQAIARRRQRAAEMGAREGRTAAPEDRAAAPDPEIAAATADIAQARALEGSARRALGIGHSDPRYWERAPIEDINTRVAQEFGYDPKYVGDRAFDRHWARRASGEELHDVYMTANRWRLVSPEARGFADNVDELLGEWGIDPHTTMGLPREEASEHIATKRAQYYAANPHAADAETELMVQRSGDLGYRQPPAGVDVSEWVQSLSPEDAASYRRDVKEWADGQRARGAEWDKMTARLTGPAVGQSMQEWTTVTSATERRAAHDRAAEWAAQMRDQIAADGGNTDRFYATVRGDDRETHGIVQLLGGDVDAIAQQLSEPSAGTEAAPARGATPDRSAPAERASSRHAGLGEVFDAQTSQNRVTEAGYSARVAMEGHPTNPSAAVADVKPVQSPKPARSSAGKTKSKDERQHTGR